MYECEEMKKWKEERKQGQHKDELPLCCHCKKFMHEADKCLEDSWLMPMYKAFVNPNHKPPHFTDDGTKGKKFIIQVK